MERNEGKTAGWIGLEGAISQIITVGRPVFAMEPRCAYNAANSEK